MRLEKSHQISIYSNEGYFYLQFLKKGSGNNILAVIR